MSPHRTGPYYDETLQLGTIYNTFYFEKENMFLTLRKKTHANEM